MNTNIYPIPLGVDCCYLIQSEGIILIDGGAPGKAKNFEKKLEKISINPEDIQIISENVFSSSKNRDNWNDR